MGTVSRHPHCVTVYDSGFTDAGQPYLVMEDMTGGTLTDQAPLPWAEAVEVGVKVAGVLSASHGAGVLHRDIKPDNLLVSAYGEPKLGDFGIARFDDSTQTRTGSVSATPAYAAPELFDGAAATEASDVYSLAATLYALITGMPPYARGGRVVPGVACPRGQRAGAGPPAPRRARARGAGRRDRARKGTRTPGRQRARLWGRPAGRGAGGRAGGDPDGDGRRADSSLPVGIRPSSSLRPPPSPPGPGSGSTSTSPHRCCRRTTTHRRWRC